jgi:endonuclease YncB( thermonuclease family)
MKRTIIFTVVVGILALFNGWIATAISPAFRFPDSVAEEVADRIDSFGTSDTEGKGEGSVTVEQTAQVKKVIDGDTIEVEFLDGEVAVVRYIGIDTPERAREASPAECFYDEATKRNEELVGGQKVKLVRDVSDTDKYGRLLRFVYVGDDFVNLRLLSEGYATLVTFPPDVSKVEEFRAASLRARETGAGLWSSCLN